MGFLEKMRNSLFDFSAADKEHEELEAILWAALAETTTDAEIEAFIRHSFNHGDAQQAEMRWALLRKLLVEYRHSDEFLPVSRLLIERFLADMSKRYSHK